jgi:pimeloyl-ACP methyl ester carboxylesterase
MFWKWRTARPILPGALVTQLACTVEGDSGRAVVLFISGFVGSRRSWDKNFHSLARTFKLVLIDTLGFGESPKPNICYTVEDHVRAIHDTLAALGVGRTHVVGHSMGCLLALAYANHYPAHVGRLALLALPYFESEEQARNTIRNGSTFNRWLAMDTPLAKAACTFMCMLRPVLQAIAPYLVRHVPHVVAKDALDHNWQSYSHTMRNVIFRGDSHRWLREFKGQVLLVHGSHDKTAPLTHVEPLAHSANVKLLRLDADHGLIFSHSELIAASLADFLRPEEEPRRGNELQG